MSDNAVSDIDSVLGDAEDNGAAVLSERRPKKRQSSVPELMRVIQEKEQRKSKKHKRDSKESENVEETSHVCRLAGESLETVKQIMVTEIGKVLSLMERKFEAQEKRIEILEAEVMQKDVETKALHSKLTAQEKTIRNLAEQLESMDTNRRMNSLILKCTDFGERSNNEDIENKVITVLNRRFPELRITANDFQTDHRLQGKHTVICKFLKTRLRNEIFEGRMSQAVDKRGAGKPAPLYINESLSPSRQALLNALLDAKRRELIYAVYTRRGAVFCKRSAESGGHRVDDMDQVKFIIDGGGPAPPGPGRGPGARPQGHPGNAHANRGPQRQRGPGGPETAGRPDLAEASTARSSPLRRDVLPHRVPGDARAAGRDPADRPAGSVPAEG